MNTAEIIKNIAELKKVYGHTNFPFDYFSELASHQRAMKHLYQVSDNINKKDNKALLELEEGSEEYKRRKFLITQDKIQQNLRLNQIEQMGRELQGLTEKFNELKSESES